MSDHAAQPDEPPTRLRAAMSATTRLCIAAILAYLFVVVLMTASAQSEVAANLADIKRPAAAAGGDERPPEYTSSYARLRKADNEQKDFRKKYEDGGLALREAAARAKERFEQAHADFDDAAKPLWQLARTLIDRGACAVSKPETLSRGEAKLILDDLEQCDPAKLDSDLLRRVNSARANGKVLLDLGAAMVREYREAEIARRAAAGYVERSNTIAAEQADLADIRQAFAPVFVLQDRIMMGGGILVPFPPSMMQIIMAFFSGLFGALLVTLVLVVYPNSDLNITTPGGNYGERVLLGGLIAVCVFIVLGGGTAVLGTSNAFADGTANFQAFSAIGVLAGMFSDRVAGWLSDKAVNFYGRNPPKPDQPVPAPPVPAPPPNPAPAAG